MTLSSRISAATHDLDQTLGEILNGILELTGAERAAILLCKYDRLCFECGRNITWNDAADKDFDISRTIANQAMQERQPVLITNVGASAVKEKQSILTLQLKAVAALPLIYPDKVLGVLYFDTSSCKHRITDRGQAWFGNFAELAAIALANAYAFRKLRNERDLHKRVRGSEAGLNYHGILYRSSAMDMVRADIERIKDINVTVLIQGETGTGKELVAQALHKTSPRHREEYICFNLSSIAPNLVEAELFGHAKGCFSGATSDKLGLFERAQGGTVFLDEIGDALPAVQNGLLRVLENGTIRRVGESWERKTDVRIIAATHRDLQEASEKGRFRKDLYYRLNIFPIRLPPLRERKEDIEILANYFLEQARKEYKRPLNHIPPETMEMLCQYKWEGNVRELKSRIAQAVLRQTWEKPVETTSHSVAEGPPLSLGEMICEHIGNVLQMVNGNQSQAARLLGLKRSTLLGKMKKYGCG